jgi:hypothetical protein
MKDDVSPATWAAIANVTVCSMKSLVDVFIHALLVGVNRVVSQSNGRNRVGVRVHK